MHFGVTLAQANPAAWTDIAIEADRLGFESCWQSDHLAIPALPEDAEERLRNSATPLLDPFAVLGWLAAHTKRIKLGTYVFQLALRHPLVGARGFATLDVLSSGRAIVGVGTGSIPEEFNMVGIDPTTRGRRLDEAMHVCRLLWHGDEVRHNGEFYNVDGVTLRPVPAQMVLPIHVGGESDAALRRAATRGDGWLGQQHTPETVRPYLDKLRRYSAAIGRKMPEISVLAPTVNSQTVREFADIGVDRLIVAPWRRTSEALSGLQTLAADVL